MLPINQPAAALRAWTVDLGNGHRLGIDVILDEARARRGADTARTVRQLWRAVGHAASAVLGTYVGAEQFRLYLR